MDEQQYQYLLDRLASADGAIAHLNEQMLLATGGADLEPLREEVRALARSDTFRSQIIEQVRAHQTASDLARSKEQSWVRQQLANHGHPYPPHDHTVVPQHEHPHQHEDAARANHGHGDLEGWIHAATERQRQLEVAFEATRRQCETLSARLDAGLPHEHTTVPQHDHPHDHPSYAPLVHEHPAYVTHQLLSDRLGAVEAESRRQLATLRMDDTNLADRVADLAEQLKSHAHPFVEHGHADLVEALSVANQTTEGLVETLTMRLEEQQKATSRLQEALSLLTDMVEAHDHEMPAHEHPVPAHNHEIDPESASGTRHVHEFKVRTYDQVGDAPGRAVYSCDVPGCSVKMALEIP